MKILLINDYGVTAGGAECIVLSLRDELRRRGHDARLFASTAAIAGLPNLADATCHGTTGPLRTPLQSANPWAERALQRILADFRPDVVHVNLYLTQLSPLILRALRTTPSVYYAQWYRAVCPLGTRRRPDGQSCEAAVGTACLRSGCLSALAWPLLMLQARFDRAWGGAFRRVTAISHAVAESLDTYGAPHLRGATVVPPGTAVVEPRQDFEALPTIVAAGRLVPEKGFDVLLRAFRQVAVRIPEAKLVIVGGGTEATPLGRLAATLGLLASETAFPGPLRVRVVEALIPQVGQLAVARALARILTVGDGAYLARLAGRAAEDLVKLAARGGEFSEDDREDLTEVLADFLAIPALGPDADNVRRRLVGVIATMRDHATSRARARLRYLCGELPPELASRLDWA